ncbi:MAG: 3-phosphoshikimate 1-carboxyvinyltransferase [Bacteroidales bacterium]|nr:3-phosphoshikimate 1-carboxyvinyltransferase [Bacteroidales bacterium]
MPRSKSESNRALMIMHYWKTQGHKDAKTQSVEDSATSISTSDDTVLLRKLLSLDFSHLPDNEVIELDCANAGTVLRFLMTAVSMTKGTFVLTGSERMKQRPVKPLVDALRSLGVSIDYLEKDSYPPIMIKGCEIAGGNLEISVEQSSQFASSLLLAAPLWKNGLSLTLTGNLSSQPYIDMTINVMKQCGVDVERNGRKITVNPSRYKYDDFKIEPDWSAAAFWYEILALSDKTQMLFKDLKIDSLQADAVTKDVFKSLGIETLSVDKGVMIKKTADCKKYITFDFINSPDLFPAVIATCAGLQVDAEFSGLKNLSIKESDRKKAMMNELSKLDIVFEEVSEDVLRMKCPDILPCFSKDNPMIFNNYKDHRIAMSLVPLAMKIGFVEMENTEVVSKSYPEFFEELFRS